MKWLVTIFWILAYQISAKAQFKAQNYGAPGTSYYQNFDSLPTVGTFSLQGRDPHHFQSSPFLPPRLAGWFFMQQAGTGSQANFYAGSGTSTSHGTISTGQTNHTDRSLGSLSTSTASYAFGIVFINKTDQNLNTIDITATIEQWRKGGSGQKNNWVFKLKTGIWQGIDTTGCSPFPAGNFSSVHFTAGSASLNGNILENQQRISIHLEGLTWKPNEQLLICWFDPDDPGNDDLCSLDDFSFKAERQISRPWIDSLRPDSIQPGSFLIRSRINPNGSKTQLQWEYDTLPTFTTKVPVVASPVFIPEGTDIAPVSGHFPGLSAGKKYFIRLLAHNEAGPTTSETIIVHTSSLPAEINIVNHSIVNREQVSFTGVIAKKNIYSIQSLHFQWSRLPDFSSFSSIPFPIPDSDTFPFLISGIPPGTNIFMRGILQQNGILSTSKIYAFQTPVYVDQFKLISPRLSTDSVIHFELILTNELTAIATNQFSLITQGVQGAKIQSIQKLGNKTTVSVHSGFGDGCIALEYSTPPDNGTFVKGLPVKAAGTACIDRSPPVIKKIGYPNNPYKSGDTVTIETHIFPDTGKVHLVQGSWAGIPLNQWSRLNDSTYLSTLIIPTGNIEIPPMDPVVCRMTLADELGNRTSELEHKVEQNKDWVDTKAPSIIQCIESPTGTYAIGDTLRWELRFSEPIICTTTGRKPYLWINVGEQNRQATLRKSDSNTLHFEYVIKSGDWDENGISWRNSITLNGSKISDMAGNTALINFILNPVIILVDGVMPIIKRVHFPQPSLYKIDEELSFTIDFSEPIKFTGDIATAVLQIQTESKTIFARLKQIKDTTLQFVYTIQSGVWDKKGIIPMRIIVGTGNQLTDLAGNIAQVLLDQSNTDSYILIDATAPQFLSPQDSLLSICASDTVIHLQGLSDFVDHEPREKISLETIIFSGNTISKLPPISFTSTGSEIFVNFPILINGKKVTENDTLQLILSDGIHHASKKIVVKYVAIIENNQLITPHIQCNESKPIPLKASMPTGGNGSYQFQWETASQPSAVFKKAGGLDTIPEFVPVDLSDSIYFRREVRSGPCSHISGIVMLRVKGSGLWMGSHSSEWNAAENWCGQQVPLPGTHVVISGGVPFSPTIHGSAYCGQLELLHDASLLLKGILQLKGHISAKSGFIQGEDGILILSGEEKQILSAKNFRNQRLGELYVRNRKGIELIDSLKIKRSLNVQAGDVNIMDQVCIEKNAVIGPTAEGSSIRGSVMVKYGVDGNKRQYHMTAHPFNHPIALKQMNLQIDITGDRSVDTNFAPTPLQLPSAFKLTHSEEDSCGQLLKWTPFKSLDGKGPDGWQPFEGISWLFRGKKGEGLNDETGWLQMDAKNSLEQITIPLKGEVNTGDQTITFPNAAVGFRLLGNPFISPIYPMAIHLSDSIAPVYWKWDPKQGISGGFTCSDFQSRDTLPPFGTWIVQLKGTKNIHQIIIPEKSKIGSNLVGSNYSESELQQSLQLEWWQDSIFLDRVTLKDNKKASTDYDHWDGIKISNPSHNLFVSTFEGNRLSFDQRTFGAKSKYVLGAVDAKPGNYQLRIRRKNWKEEYGWQLHDRYAGKWWPLDKDTTITFFVDHDTLSQANDRFHIGSPWLLTYDTSVSLKLRLRLWPVPAKDILYAGSIRWPQTNVWVYLFHTSGQLIRSYTIPAPTKSVLEINVTGIPPGVYELMIGSPDKKFMATGRWIKQ